MAGFRNQPRSNGKLPLKHSYKVYTVNQESRYLIVQGIPAVGTHDDLLKMFALYGAIEEYRLLDEYPAEEFTEVMWIKFQKIPSARIAKRKMDNQSFYGGVLHVCYAPEYETVQDTREKLKDRRKTIASKIRRLEAEEGSTSNSPASNSTMASSEEWSYRPRRTTQQKDHHPQQALHHVHPPQDYTPRQPQTPQHQYAAHHPPPEQEHFVENQSMYPKLPPPPQHPPPYSLHMDPFTLNNSVIVKDVPEHYPHSKDKAPTQHGSSTSSEAPQTCGMTEADGSTHTSSQQIIIKDFKNKTVPKFVPRQIKGIRKPLVKKHLLTESSLRDKDKAIKKTSSDDVNTALKMESFVLRGVQGPQLPEAEEERRATFKVTETGSESVDLTVAAIRKRVQEFSAVAPPPQLKRKRKT